MCAMDLARSNNNICNVFVVMMVAARNQNSTGVRQIATRQKPVPGGDLGYYWC